MFILKAFSGSSEQQFLTLRRGRIMGQTRNLRALAGICEFHESYFWKLLLNPGGGGGGLPYEPDGDARRLA